jgi:phosphoribosyl 1,2-cyclic phosphodiesterase
MLEFISFGSGSSGNCYLLRTQTEGLLIDAGVGMRTLKKYFRDFGINLSDIQYVLVTHDHADHVKSVGSISNDLHVPVYATADVFRGIEHNYCVRRKVNGASQHIITAGASFRLGPFRVKSFTVPHDSNDNVGYRITCGNTVFCLMTDVGHVTEEMKTYIGEADYLVLEANHDEEMLRGGPYSDYLKVRVGGDNGHLSNRDCALALADYASPRLKHVWLCHLSEENNHPELARKTVEMILRSHGIVAGKDFQLDVLKRKTPSGPFSLE